MRRPATAALVAACALASGCLGERYPPASEWAASIRPAAAAVALSEDGAGLPDVRDPETPGAAVVSAAGSGEEAGSTSRRR